MASSWQSSCMGGGGGEKKAEHMERVAHCKTALWPSSPAFLQSACVPSRTAPNIRSA